MSVMQGRTTSALSARQNEEKKEKNSMIGTSDKVVSKTPATSKKTPAIDQKMNKILKSTMNASSVSKGEQKGSSSSRMQQVLGNAIKKKISTELNKPQQSQKSARLATGESRVGTAQTGRASVGGKPQTSAISGSQ